MTCPPNSDRPNSGETQPRKTAIVGLFNSSEAEVLGVVAVVYAPTRVPARRLGPAQRVRSGRAVVDLISDSVIVELISWTVGKVSRRPKANSR